MNKLFSYCNTFIFSSTMIVLAFSSLPICSARSNISIFELPIEHLFDLKIDSVLGYEQSLENSPATVYVYNESDFQHYGWRDLKDVLKHVPGLEYVYAHSWLNGGQRGLSGTLKYTKFLIDGREASSRGVTIQNQFPLFNIHRVEIIMGPATVLYGADAFAGVINIVTKTHENTANGMYIYGNAGVGADNFNSQSTAFSSIQQWHDWDISFHMSALKQDDPDYTDFVTTSDFSALNTHLRRDYLESGQYPFRDENLGYTATLSLSTPMFDDGELQFGADYRGSRDGGGIENPELIFTNFKDAGDVYRAYLSYKQHYWDGNMIFAADYMHITEDRDYTYHLRDDSQGLPPPLFHFRTKNSESDDLRLQMDLRLSEWDNYLIIGGQYRTIDLAMPTSELETFDVLKPFLKREKYGLYIQDEQVLGLQQWRLIAGARIDHCDCYGSVVTFRGGLQYQLNNNLVGKLLHGESFQEPSYFELGTNPHLKPAKGNTTEINFQYHNGSKWEASLSLYHTEAKDLMQEDRQANDGVSRNIGADIINGAESQFKINLQNWHFAGWFSITDSSTDYDIAKKKLGLEIRRRFANSIELNTIAKYTDAIDTEALNSNGERFYYHVKPYTTVDLILRKPDFKIMQDTNLDVSIAIYNLLNRQNYYPNNRGPDPIQFLDEGRSIFLNVNATF